MMEIVRQIKKKQTKTEKKKSKFLGLFLVFHECIAIKIHHKKFGLGQRYIDCWVGKARNKNLPLGLGFSHIYLDKKFEDYHQNERLPFDLYSIHIGETIIEFSFRKKAEKMPKFKYADKTK